LLYKLNPAFNRWATDPKAPHTLLIPKEKLNTVQHSLTQYPAKERMSWQHYKIKSGDSISAIARKFNTTTSTITSVNKLKSSSIRAGKSLLIPFASKGSSYYSSSQQQRLAKRQNTSKKGRTRIEHTVKRGESFWSIAKKYQISPNNIAYWNNMATRDTLREKQKLVLWLNKNKQKGENIRSGDSLSHIANKFNVAINDIQSWNNISKHNLIKPGQNLKLFVTIIDQI